MVTPFLHDLTSRSIFTCDWISIESHLNFVFAHPLSRSLALDGMRLFALGSSLWCDE